MQYATERLLRTVGDIMVSADTTVGRATSIVQLVENEYVHKSDRRLTDTRVEASRVTDARFEVIVNVARNDDEVRASMDPLGKGKIAAVNRVRILTACGLREAKDAVEKAYPDSAYPDGAYPDKDAAIAALRAKLVNDDPNPFL